MWPAPVDGPLLGQQLAHFLEELDVLGVGAGLGPHRRRRLGLGREGRARCGRCGTVLGRGRSWPPPSWRRSRPSRPSPSWPGRWPAWPLPSWPAWPLPSWPEPGQPCAATWPPPSWPPGAFLAATGAAFLATATVFFAVGAAFLVVLAAFFTTGSAFFFDCSGRLVVDAETFVEADFFPSVADGVCPRSRHPLDLGALARWGHSALLRTARGGQCPRRRPRQGSG